jgi:large conductance mechanosensitive channel
MSVIKEFKEFAMRGNVVDMAVGIIIGGAFGKIISSLVSDILMPPIGLLVGGVDFKDLQYVLKEGVLESTNAAGDVIAAVPAVTIGYGNFIQTTIDFLIIAFAIFMVIKGMNQMKKKPAVAPAAPPAPPEPSKEEKLLAEIRDILKNQK